MTSNHRRQADCSVHPPTPLSRLTDLDQLLQRALVDGREEPTFFRALLDATVFAHVPLSDDSQRLRFFQFIRPDNGQTVLPFFSDITKAEAIERADARIVAVSGRTFFKLTLGATLMLNPNDAFCVLYPEEILALLTTGAVPRIDNEILQTERTLGFRPPVSAPDWFQPCLLRIFSTLPYIQQAYLVEAVKPEDPSHVTLLISLGVDSSMAERAVRAVTAQMQHEWRDLKVNVDMTTYDPTGGPPDWATAVGVGPIYDRKSPANPTGEEAGSAK